MSAVNGGHLRVGVGDVLLGGPGRLEKTGHDPDGVASR